MIRGRGTPAECARRWQAIATADAPATLAALRIIADHHAASLKPDDEAELESETQTAAQYIAEHGLAAREAAVKAADDELAAVETTDIGGKPEARQ